MKHTLTLSLACLLAGPVAALADQNTMNHGAMQGMSMQGMTMQGTQGMHGSMAQTNTGVGTVNRVDMQNGKVNLTHGPIQSLGWPGMTMDFSVRDKSLLAGLRPGERVEFNVVKAGPGQFYIDRIAPAQ